MPSENETTVIEVFLGDYIPTRLAHMFLMEAGEPFLKFINFFESRQVRAHLLFIKMGLLLHKLFTMFLKSGGRDRMTPARLLKVNFKDKELQLSREVMFIGEKAKRFMKKIGLTANSPELHEFFEGIYRFYHETADKLVKY